jgi:hypothetical protein
MNADHPSGCGLVPARWRHGIRRLRFLRFRFLPLAIGARKARMALRAEGRHRRGHDPGKDRHSSRQTWFLRNRATTLPAEGRAQVAADVVFTKSRNNPPAGAGSSRRVRPGRGHEPGKDGQRSRRTWFCEIAQQPRPPPGQAPPAGFGTGGAQPGEGRAQVAADVVFAKLRNNPGLRRGRLLPPGSARVGAQPGKGQAQVAADVVFAKLRNDPPAGFGTGGGTTRGRTGAGRGGRGFCEIAQRPSRRLRRGRGTTPGKNRHRSRRM